MKRLVAEMDALTAYKWCAPRAWQDHDPAVQRKGAAGPDKIREGGDGLVCERFRFVLRHTGLRVSAGAFAPVSARNSHPRGTVRFCLHDLRSVQRPDPPRWLPSRLKGNHHGCRDEDSQEPETGVQLKARH